MRVFADLQLHSPYSRATSKNMNLKELAGFASIKGLNIIGTGDCTHPDWRKEIQTDLQEAPDPGLYRLKDGTFLVQYMITGEVNTTFQFGEKSRRIHHCLLVPSIESADAVSDRLAKYGTSEATVGLRFVRLHQNSLMRCLKRTVNAWCFLRMHGPLGSASSGQTVVLIVSSSAIRIDLIEYSRLKQACPQILR